MNDALVVVVKNSFLKLAGSKHAACKFGASDLDGYGRFALSVTFGMA